MSDYEMTTCCCDDVVNCRAHFELVFPEVESPELRYRYVPMIWLWRWPRTNSRSDKVTGVTSKSQGVRGIEHETLDYWNQRRSLGCRSRDLSETCAIDPVEISVV